MAYGSETRPVKVEDMQRLERAERMMVRRMCGVSLKDIVSSEKLLSRLDFESVYDIVRRGRLRWFGYVERKPDEDWVKRCQSLEVVGKAGRGRGRKTWLKCVKHDMKDVGCVWRMREIVGCGKVNFLVKRLSRASVESRRKMMMMTRLGYCET